MPILKKLLPLSIEVAQQDRIGTVFDGEGGIFSMPVDELFFFEGLFGQSRCRGGGSYHFHADSRPTFDIAVGRLDEGKT